jgi:hypothetical protein
MNCERASDLLIDSLPAPLPPAAAAALAQHQAGCDACRAEAAALIALWEELGRLPAETPDETARQRFAALLAPHLARRAAARRHGWAAATGALEDRLARRLPQRPLAQLTAAAAAVLLAGLAGAGIDAAFGGRGPQSGSGEVGALRHEVHALARQVTLSLLKQDSAVERLRGVSFGRQAGGDDQRVQSALLDTLSRDSNVNVRLAAVDALAPIVGRPAVRDHLLRELVRQTSPTVQIALIDVLLAQDPAGSSSGLAALADDRALDPLVRDYLRSRLGQQG